MRFLSATLLLALFALGSGCEKIISGEMRVEACVTKKVCGDALPLIPTATWAEMTEIDRRSSFDTDRARLMLLDDSLWSDVGQSVFTLGGDLGDVAKWRNRHFFIGVGTIEPAESRYLGGRLEIGFRGVERGLAEQVAVALEQAYWQFLRGVGSNLAEQRAELDTLRAEVASGNLPAAEIEKKKQLLEFCRSVIEQTEAQGAAIRAAVPAGIRTVKIF